MRTKRLVLILALAASAVTAVYATREPAPEEAVPAAEGEIERIVIVAKREHVADQQH
jgi:Flp pilus assembly protein CpaB